LTVLAYCIRGFVNSEEFQRFGIILYVLKISSGFCFVRCTRKGEKIIGRWVKMENASKFVSVQGERAG